MRVDRERCRVVQDREAVRAGLGNGLRVVVGAVLGVAHVQPVPAAKAGGESDGPGFTRGGLGAAAGPDPHEGVGADAGELPQERGQAARVEVVFAVLAGEEGAGFAVIADEVAFFPPVTGG